MKRQLKDLIEAEPETRISSRRKTLSEDDLPFDDSVVLAESAAHTEEIEEPEIPKKDREPYDGNTAYTLYLREIGQTKLLTPKEEITLANRIHKGDKRAREEMITANLRLVVKIAREYEEYGLPLLDLINEGNIGLMKAVERFDPKKGA
jgi:RNA polymerase primary sigma factor